MPTTGMLSAVKEVIGASTPPMTDERPLQMAFALAQTTAALGALG